MMQGKVVAVTTVNAGAEIVEDSTGVLLRVGDASPFDETGGTVLVGGESLPYVSADLDADTITLAEPLPVLAGDRVEVDPPRPMTEVTVRVDDDDEPMVARVPHAMKARIPDGVRDDPATAETVLLDYVGNTLTVMDVIGRDGSSTFGDPTGRGVDVGDGMIVRDTLVVDSLSSNGDVDIAGSPLLGGTLDGASGPGWLDRMSAGSVARQRWTTETNYRPAGEEWGYAGLGATCRAGRLYMIVLQARAGTDTAGAITQVRLRVAAGGEAGLLSEERAVLDLAPSTSETHRPAGGTATFIGYAEDTALDVLVTHRGIGGGRSRMTMADLAILDVGPQGTYGGGSYRIIAPTATIDPAPPSAPPPTRREFTTTWTASASATYRGSGQRRTDTLDLVQGYHGSGAINGVQSGLILFAAAATGGEERGKSLGQAITGATITKAELRLYVNHTGQSGGSTLRLSNPGATSIPSTFTTVPTRTKSVRADSYPWVEVPVSWFSDPSANRGVAIGGGGSKALSEYLRANGASQTSRPVLRLTYVR